MSLAAATQLHATSQVVFTFPAGDAQGWTQVTVPGGADNNYSFFPTSANFGGRINWTDPTGAVAGMVVTDASSTDARGSTHNTAVLRSPSFTLNGFNSSADIPTYIPNGISFKLLAGKGSPTGPANFAALPPQSVDNGSSATLAYLGVGLRRVSDGAYLLWGRRSTDAQSSSWETVTWNSTTLTAATSADPAGTLYTLDFIDAGHGNWGWVAMDDVTLSYDQSLVSNITVRPQDIIGAESGSDHQLSLRFTRDNNISQALKVSFTLEGSAVETVDFQALPNNTGTDYNITFPAGQATVDLPINIIPNSITQSDRSVTVRLESASTYTVGATNNVASVWISDLPQKGLVTVSGPMNTGTYLPFANPLGQSPNGSLFFYGEGNRTDGFMTIGIRPGAAEDSSNGGVDVGRNTATSGNAIFDYLDNKGAASATARVPGVTGVNLNAGHFTLIGEIQFQTATTGTLRGWIWDGQNGTLNYSSPDVTTTFSSGFNNLGDQIYLRLDGNGAGTTWTNARVLWVPGTDTATLTTAFAQLTPTRPFLYVDGPAASAGEFGSNQDLPFTIFRSGPPAGALTVPLILGGTASAADFSAFPATASIANGTSFSVVTYHVVPDDLNEGTETLSVDLDSTTATAWLPGTTFGPLGTILDRPFQDWMFNNLPFGSHDTALTDTDHDGVVNLLEYFSGTSLNDATSRSTVGLAPGVKDTLRFLRVPGLTDVNGAVMWSTDMVNWHASGESDGQRTVTIAETIVSSQQGGADTVDAKATVSNGNAADRLFLRLAVTLP